MCAPCFRFVLAHAWGTRTLTYRKSLITTGSSVSRLMERFCLRQRLWINAFVLTTAYWICQVRTLKERKYQLPVAIFGLRQRLLHATASAFAYSLFGRKSHAYGSPRCKCPNRVNVFFQFGDKQSGRHGLRPFATASFSRVRLFWGNSEPPQLRKMFNSLVTRNLTWLDLLENLQVELS